MLKDLLRLILSNKLLSAWVVLLITAIVLFFYAQTNYYESQVYFSIIGLLIVNSIIFLTSYKNNKQIALAILLFIVIMELAFVGLFILSQYSYVY